ncbi:MAG: lysoplasmalogenase [Oscillospiraceae bacterium]|nr:lysoplasmalogenase [Oscillospiraceae bacterium]
MPTCIVIICAGAIALALFLKEKLKKYSLKAVFLKTTVSVLFVALAVCGWYAASNGRPSALGLFIIPGLVCGLLGDIWLDLKYVFPQSDEPFTYAGFLCFGIGHILYIVGMSLQFCPRGAEVYVLVPAALGVALGFGNMLLEKPMKLDYGSMKPVAIAYGALLFSTVLVSGSLAMLHGWHSGAMNAIFAGGALFAVSDLVLSGTYFGKGKDRPVDIILNYLTYYPAQYLIALSLFLLR